MVLRALPSLPAGFGARISQLEDSFAGVEPAASGIRDGGAAGAGRSPLKALSVHSTPAAPTGPRPPPVTVII